MWIVRFLNGPMAGQVVPLTKHSTLLGRAPNCDIKIASPNISKEHTRIEVFEDKVIISDAGSRNGTFLNGVQIRSSKAKSGDRVSVHDIFFEVQKVPPQWAQRLQQASSIYGGNVAYQTPPAYQQHASQHHAQTPSAAPVMMDSMPAPSEPENAGLKLARIQQLAEQYMERVVLPGVFRLPKMFEFHWVLAGFMGIFIVLVTALSMIPLTQILRSSIEEESQQHALTIATTLAKVNRPFLMQGLDTSVTVDLALSRPGVKKALIINNLDGNIVAPASQAGSFADIPYVHEGRKIGKEAVYQVDSSTVVAIYPIDFYNADSGTHAITHWAVVLYDMSSLAVDNGRVLSLFITTLFIALLLGAVLYYFLYKMIEHPIKSLNVQLDSALKDGIETVHVDYQFPAMQLLASNVSSALSRSLAGQQSSNNNLGLEHDRNREIANLVELIGFASMGIRAADLSIAAINQAFESRLGSAAAQLMSLTVNEITDQALKLSIKDLIERVDQNPDEMASNTLEFSGTNFQVVAQAVFGTSKVAYYLVVLIPSEADS